MAWLIIPVSLFLLALMAGEWGDALNMAHGHKSAPAGARLGAGLIVVVVGLGALAALALLGWWSPWEAPAP